MLSNESEEITESKVGMALSCFHEKYSLRLLFCRNYISMKSFKGVYTRVGTLIVATIYLQLIQK
jgi:hypothetical protein